MVVGWLIMNGWWMDDGWCDARYMLIDVVDDMKKWVYSWIDIRWSKNGTMVDDEWWYDDRLVYDYCLSMVDSWCW